MKIINKYIFKSLITPFILSTIAIVIVLLTQIILKKINMFLGEDIPIDIILKFFLYNTAGIVSLAIPMAVLIATIMTFGKLSSNNEITAFKATGLSYTKLLTPSLIFGFIIVSLMIPFNLWLLPEMNKKTADIMTKIELNNPTTDILDGYVKNDYKNLEKIIFVGEEDEVNNIFSDIIIHDKINTTLTLANKGTVVSLNDGLVFDLKDGSIHHKVNNDEQQIIYFDNYYISIPFDANPESKKYKMKEGDRKLNINELINIEIPEVRNKISLLTQAIKDSNKVRTEISEIIQSNELINENSSLYLQLIDRDRNIKRILNGSNGLNEKLNNSIKRLNGLLVELHKKFAIPFSCFIFILLGIPLGIISNKGSMAISIATSIFFFIIYWAFLTVGEILAEDGVLSPMLSMWLGNIIVGILALYLFYISSKNIKLNFNFANRFFMKKLKVVK